MDMVLLSVLTVRAGCGSGGPGVGGMGCVRCGTMMPSLP